MLSRSVDALEGGFNDEARLLDVADLSSVVFSGAAGCKCGTVAAVPAVVVVAVVAVVVVAGEPVAAPLSDDDPLTEEAADAVGSAAVDDDRP